MIDVHQWAEIRRLHRAEGVGIKAIAMAFRRFAASDVRAILEAGVGIPGLVAPGSILQGSFPSVPSRPLAAYAVEGG